MPLNINRDISVRLSGKFNADELIKEVRAVCDGEPSDYDVRVSAYKGTDQRDGDHATLHFTKNPKPKESGYVDPRGPNA